MTEHLLSPDDVVGSLVPEADAAHGKIRIEDLLTTMVREIAHYGQDSLRIPAALAAMLDDLASTTHPRYRATIDELRDEVRRKHDYDAPPEES